MSAPADALELFDHDVYNRTEEGFREFAESLVQNIDEVFFWRDADSVVPYFVSYAFERIFGRTCATVYGQPSSWIEAIHPDDREAALRDQLQLGANGKMEAEYRIVRPDGEVRWLSVRIFPASPKDQSRTLIGIAQDCTDRILMEDTQEFLAAIVRGSEEGIMGSDWDGRIVSWNHGAEKLFGYTAEEAIGQFATLVVPVDQRPSCWKMLDRARGGEQIERYETVRVAKGGKLIDVSVILSAVKNRAGKGVGVSAIYRDISDHKRASAELLRAKETAEETSRMKSEFLANMSHEIRTPMNGVIGMSEVLLDTDLTAEQREYVEIVQYSAKSLLSIINDILDFSKIEARKLVLENKHFYVREVLESVLREMEVQAGPKGLTLSCEVASGVPEVVVGDPVRLRQILVNLIGNAIKFTKAGGVEVKIGPGEPGSLHFSVKDTGIGVAVEKQQTIFDAFVQADGSVRREAGGTGLGLTIASRLVGLMNGRIWLESDGGSGSVFHFTASFGEPLEH